MTFYRVYGDEAGETHIVTITLPELDFKAPDIKRICGFLNVPASSMSVVEMSVSSLDDDLHPAPERRILAFLGGAMEIRSTTGDRVVVGAGDCILVDDVGTKGHYTAAVGSEPWLQIAIRIDDAWQAPTA